MMKSIKLLLVALIFLQCKSSKASYSQVPKPTEKSNIILIMADDMGYSDIGCYGGDVQTPNLDALASSGLRFTQFYNGARCCPTRASLMTGCYPHQVGIGDMTNPHHSNKFDLGLPAYRGALSENSVTLAEVLKTAGYSTQMTGKWHLGDKEESQWPLQRGFDKFYGLLEGASNYFKPEFPRGITLMNDTISITDKNYYTTNAFTDYAIKFIGDSKQQDSEKPFFLYLAYNAPHWPLQAPDSVVNKYKGTYLNGWTKLRESRYAKMKEMGLIDKNWALTAQDSREWNSLNDAQKKEMDLRRAIYSAQIDVMDQNIGKLVKYLKDKKLYDNTLIIFLSDNGACAEFAELGSGPASDLGAKDLTKGLSLSYGKAWANGSNTPYREYKHWVNEGGISTPMIVHWPKGIPKTNDGKLVSEYGFLPDLMATFCDVANTKYPTKFNGNDIPLSAGKSLMPLFVGKKEQIHQEAIFWEHEGNKAVRLGKYKLVSQWSNEKETTWELYDMETDRTEIHNLALKIPDMVKKLNKEYNDWATKNHVLAYSDIKKLSSKKR